MNVGTTGHGLQKGHFIYEFGLFRKNAADPFAALAVLLEFERAFHDRPLHSRSSLDLSLGAQLLTIQPGKRGLVVPGIHRTDATVHKQLNHTPHLGVMM